MGAARSEHRGVVTVEACGAAHSGRRGRGVLLHLALALGCRTEIRALFGKLRGYFTAIALLGSSRIVDVHVAAAELYARARWRAITPPSPHDCLIAITAIGADALLPHDDRDYEHLVEVESRLKLVPRK